MKASRVIITLFTLMGFAYLSSMTAFGLDLENGPKKKLDRPPALISPKTHKYLSKVHTDIGKEDYEDALELLQRLEKTTKSNKAEYAQVLQAYGFLYGQKNELAKAAKYFRMALDTEGLDERSTLSTMFLTAQVQMGSEKYKEAISTLLEWFSYVESPMPQAYVLLAGGYAELKQYDNAIYAAELAIKKSKEPKEGWYKFLVGLYFTKEKFAKAAPILKELIELYPEKPKYWNQLSVAYFSMNQEKEALVVLELAHKKGHLTEEKNIMNLVHLYQSLDVPFKAAKLMEDSIEKGLVERTEKNMRVLAGAYQNAQELEKAAIAMGNAAAVKNSADLFAQQGNIYLQMRNWKEARKALSKSVQLGGLKKPGQALIALGMAEFNDGDVNSAKKRFVSAEKYDKTKSQAEKWIKFIELEEKSATAM